MFKQASTIALITDTHYWPGSKQRFGGDESQLQPWSEEIERTLLADLAQANLALILHLGDITCGGGSFAMPADMFQTTLENTCRNLAGLGLPFYGLPGNHDTLAGENDWSMAERLLGLQAGLGRTIDLPQARLILLNTHGHTSSQREEALPGDPTYGWVSEAELARLQADLKSADRSVVVFSHQLLQPWPGEAEWHELYGVINRQAVLDILSQSKHIRAVFQGHAHRLNVQTARVGQQVCRFVVAPAVMAYPMAWLKLTFGEKGLRVEMKSLVLPDLQQLSRDSGEGHTWRAGQVEWQDFVIQL